MKFKKLLFIPLLAMLITGCQHGNNDKTSSNCDSCLVREGDAKDDLLPTPITDSLKFAQANELEGKKFAGADRW